MMNILTQKSVVEVIDEILVKNYAAETQGNYKKQLRIQIRNAATQNENFAKAFEWQVSEEFSSTPDIDDIDEVLTEMSEDMKGLLDQYGIIEKAKEYSKRERDEETHFAGYEVTQEQKVLCDEVWDSVQSWFGECPKELDVQGNLEDTYEEEVGKSCVYWYSPSNFDGDVCHDTLPRDEDYETNGYTDKFYNWAADKIVQAVAEAGCETRKEVADYIKKICPVVRG